MDIKSDLALKEAEYFLHIQACGGIGSSSGSFNETEFEEKADALYEAAEVLNDNPNTSSATTYMQALTDLNTYLSKNTPPKGSLAETIYKQFLQETIGSKTLADICAKNTDPASITLILQNAQGPLMEGLKGQLYNVSNQFVDKNTMGIRDDVFYLEQVLSNYQNIMQLNPPPDQSTINRAVIAIGNAMHQLNADLPKGLQDGFLTILQTAFGSISSTDKGAQTLAELCKNFTGKGDPSQTDITNLEKALNSMGEENSGGGSFYELLSKTFAEENGHWN